MRIMGLNKRNDISIRLNDADLVPEEKTENYWDWDSWSDIIYLNITASIIKKVNKLKIKRESINAGYIGEIEVIEMELAINYLQHNTIGGFKRK
mgnify:CR=1 FL=1